MMSRAGYPRIAAVEGVLVELPLLQIPLAFPQRVDPHRLTPPRCSESRIRRHLPRLHKSKFKGEGIMYANHPTYLDLKESLRRFPFPRTTLLPRTPCPVGIAF